MYEVDPDTGPLRRSPTTIPRPAQRPVQEDITDSNTFYGEDPLMTGCAESIEATTVRKRRLCFTGFIVRMPDDRLPRSMLWCGERMGVRSSRGDNNMTD